MSAVEIQQVTWSIAIGALAGVACSLLGCFLVLRRLSLLGDAVSHGVLPGIALAVLITNEIGGFGTMVGAMVFGVLTAFLTQMLTNQGKVTEDASLGVVYTSLFAAGVVIISVFMRGRHVDVNCVLFGDFTSAVLIRSKWLDEWFGWDIPRAAPNMLAALVMTLAFIVVLWKELKLTAFDSDLASAMGFRTELFHYLFVALVAGCTVATFEAMGLVLVLAMLVVPAATAQLLTDRLATMMIWAAGLAVTSATVGYLAARWVFACNVSGMIAAVAGCQFLLAVLLAPRHGVCARFLRHALLALRIAREEILGGLYRSEEAGHAAASVRPLEHGLSPWTIQLAFWQLRRRGWIARQGGDAWRLTPVGRLQAESLVRAHRLWESFLGENFELPLDHLHAPAARMEHFIGPEMQRQLAAQLQEAAVDPHGKQIP